MDGSFIQQEYFTQPIEAHVQKHFVSICNQRPGKKLALEIEEGRIWKWLAAPQMLKFDLIFPTSRRHHHPANKEEKNIFHDFLLLNLIWDRVNSRLT